MIMIMIMMIVMKWWWWSADLVIDPSTQVFRPLSHASVLATHVSPILPKDYGQISRRESVSFFLNSRFTPLAYFRYAFEHKKHGWFFVKFFIVKWMEGQSGKNAASDSICIWYIMNWAEGDWRGRGRGGKDASKDESATKYVDSILYWSYRPPNCAWSGQSVNDVYVDNHRYLSVLQDFSIDL